MLASTELINFYGMSDARMQQFIGILKAQGITMFTIRLNAFNEWTTGTSGGLSAAKRMIDFANAEGLEVAVDLHTWYTTWDNYFRDGAGNYLTNRTRYIEWVRTIIREFAGVNVEAFMVLNEPQARTASASENQFILSIVKAAQEETSAPVSVRFMGGYTPSTGHYSPAIEQVADFVCRNSFWDARSPGASVYGCTEQKLLDSVDWAHGMGKEIWIPEFGAHRSNLENQRSYVEALVAWAAEEGFDRVFCWVSQPTSNSENYNIFDGYTPFPAFYELVSDGAPPPPPPPPPEEWTFEIHHSTGGDTVPRTGTYTVAAGEDTVIEALPGDGWFLVRWEVDGADMGDANPYVLGPYPAGAAVHVMALFDVEPLAPECVLAADCVALHGEAPAGKRWACVNGGCVLQDAGKYEGTHARMFPFLVVVASLARWRDMYQRRHAWFKRLHDMLHPLI